MAGPGDNTVTSVPLEIVDLLSDGDLPSAADPATMKGALAAGAVNQIATGNAIKASFGIPTEPIGARGLAGKNQVDGFRLQSMGFQGIEVGDVVTFSLNVATDCVGSSTHSPNLPQYQIYLQSGWAGFVSGTDVRVLQSTVNLAENNNYTYTIRPGLNLPRADQGWSRLSINFTPAHTVQWFDVDADGDMDSADLAILQGIADSLQFGWDATDENSVVLAGIQVRSHAKQEQATVNVWLDNLMVYRSAYEIDMALNDAAALELTEAMAPTTGMQNLIAGAVFAQTTGDLDGSIESAAGNSLAELSAIGISLGYAGGNVPANDFPAKDWINGADANVTIGSKDHTNDGGSDQCLQLILAGDDGPDGAAGDWSAIRNGIDTAVVAGSGSGLYVFECYVAKDRAVNSVSTDKHPEIRVLLQEVAPNWLGTASGYIYNKGGLPDDVDTAGDIPYNWTRAVATMYIPDCEALMGRLHTFDTFKADVGNFAVPLYFDDLALYKVEDAAQFFDADLYDN
jgi:hypothetical protein